MHNPIKIIISISCMMIITLSTCKIVKTDTIGITPENLRIRSGEISGWSENQAGYSAANSIAQIAESPGGLDGEAYYYNNGTGYTGGIIEELTNTDGTTARLFIMDFGSTAVASSAYDGAITSYAVTNKSTLPNYPENQAIISISSSGALAFYHKDRFLFRLMLTSPPSDNQSITYTEMFFFVLAAKF